jgi:hypothetical protein
MTLSQERRAVIGQNLVTVRRRIAAAAEAAGRAPTEITLIAVTKLFPASDAALLAELGVADLGENRDQEAAGKAAEVAVLTAAPVRWHFVGQLQTNKARSAARYADLVHSVDRPALVSALATGIARAGRGDAVLDVLVQVSIDADLDRGGVAPSGVIDLAATVDAAAGLRLRGVMAVAPLGMDPDDAFGALAGISADLRSRFAGAELISAGMSDDLEAAIRHGATHVRIGTALLGRRQRTFG